MTNADSVKIESDERGFELHVYVDEEPEVDENGLMVINVHGCAVELLREVTKAIGPWYEEGESVRRSMFLCKPEDVDESGGYALSDPKHPRFHSVHADIWDARDGK